MIPVILASNSPRRKEILQNLGITFTCISPQADETSDAISAEMAVKEISRKKAKAAQNQLLEQQVDLTDTLIISADTAVVHNMEILGKPKTPKAAKEMLTALSGKTHFVTTAITLLWNDLVVTERELTKIRFNPIPPEAIDAYVATKIPLDKAGGYGIQDYASLWIQGIQGDYFNVVGFPICRFYSMINKLGLNIVPEEGLIFNPDFPLRR